MMDYQTFKEVIKAQIVAYLPQEYNDARVEIKAMNKVNRTLDSLMVCLNAKENYVPNVYVNEVYSQYQAGESLNECMQKLATEIQQKRKILSRGMPDLDITTIPDKVVMQLINKEQNKEMLKQLPHRDFQDLAVIYRWIVDQDKQGIASVIIKNELLKEAGLTEEMLYTHAVENTKKILPAKVVSANEELYGEYLSQISEMGLDESMILDMKPDPKECLYMLTNEQSVYGAVSMLYEENLRKLAEKIGTDLYILPSSIHETMIVSVEKGSPEQLAEMVCEANMNIVELGERLSNNVYHYDKDLRKISIATDAPNKRLDGEVKQLFVVNQDEPSR